MAEPRVWTSAEQGKMRSNSKNHVLLRIYLSWNDNLDIGTSDIVVEITYSESPVEQANICSYRATLVLIMCTPTYGASIVG